MQARSLVPNMRTREKVFSVLSTIFAGIGGAGLILLSVFDTKRHSTLHRLFLLIFMVGVAFSALFTCIEVRLMDKAATFRILTILKVPMACQRFQRRSRDQNSVLRESYYRYTPCPIGCRLWNCIVQEHRRGRCVVRLSTHLFPC